MLILHEILEKLWPEVPAPAKTKELLTQAGFEVESVTPVVWPEITGQVVVGKIESIETHPNADKIRVTKTVVTPGEPAKTIVCGAWNIQPGQFVPVVLPGTTLPGNFKIEVREVRGVRSEGMLASADELGLGKIDDGILILEGLDDSAIGQPLKNYWPDSTLYDLSITPNRPDALSHFGIARDLRLLCGQAVTDYPADFFGQIDLPTTPPSITPARASDVDCPAFSLTELTIPAGALSPYWLKRHLSRLSLPAKGLIVDASNYILTIFGQPTHTYDADTIQGNQLSAESMTSDYNVQLLDGENHNLSAGDLVITDSGGPVALAGVIGGTRTAVSSDTTRVLLEAANFRPGAVRASRKRHGLNTDASYLYERAVDVRMVELAPRWFMGLLSSASAKAQGNIINGMTKYEAPSIPFSPTKTNRLLGLDISADEQEDILTRGGSKLSRHSEGVPEGTHDESRLHTIFPPSWRPDLRILEDLAEEIARVYGLDNIKPEPLNLPDKNPDLPASYIRRESLRDELVNLGLLETINSPFVSNKEVLAYGLDKSSLFKITAPASPEMAWARPCLRPGLTRALRQNLPEADELWIFEIGHVASVGQGEILPNVAEAERLGIAGYAAEPKKMLTLVHTLLTKLSLKVKATETKPQIGESGRVEYASGGKVFGHLAILDEAWLSSQKIRRPVAVAEFDLAALLSNSQANSYNLPRHINCFRPYSKFPKITRDVTFVLNSNADDWFQQDMAPLPSEYELLESVSQKSDFTKDGQRLLTTSFTFRAPGRTLQDTEVDGLLQTIVTRVENGGKAKRQEPK